VVKAPFFRLTSGISALIASLLAASCGGDSHAGEPAPAECSEQTPGELFNERIAPLLAQDRPHSCNQCHLSGVELGSFARETPCETMACLVEQGLVVRAEPDKSLILTWIKRAKPESELITDKVIQEEYDGFRTWIEYSASCQASVCAGVTCGQPTDDPFCDTENEGQGYDPARDPGGCDDKTLEQLFRDTVYASRGRCFPCHFEEQADTDMAPKWILQSGNCDNASLLTMRNVVARGYVNNSDPMKSLMLLKPLGPEYGGVEHGGHSKITPNADNDAAYKNFTYWLGRYASCAK
jgi:hypothetical protein